MIELERHIEILLLSNDCVIVPDLGGFVAHHIDARYDDEDHLFLPPLRSLGFNPQLKTLNDHLLAQSYIEAYDISYPEAIRRIEDEVNELKQRLTNEGFYELNDIGTLRLNEDGKYVFEPCEAGILTPSLYGLSSFEYKALQSEDAVEKAEASVDSFVQEHLLDNKSVHTHEHSIKRQQIAAEGSETTASSAPPASAPAEDTAQIVNIGDRQTDDDHAEGVTIKYSWIRNVVASAVAIICFFLFSSPIYNSEEANLSSMARMNNASIIPTDTSVKKDVKKFKPADKKADIYRQAKIAQDSAQMKSREIAKTPDNYYCLVLASHVTIKNAEIFAQEMRDKGYENTRVYIHNHIVRVIYGAYDTESEAYHQVSRLHHRSDFSDTWVYQVKD